MEAFKCSYEEAKKIPNKIIRAFYAREKEKADYYKRKLWQPEKKK